jgi:hypothetical protein
MMVAHFSPLLIKCIYYALPGQGQALSLRLIDIIMKGLQLKRKPDGHAEFTGYVSPCRDPMCAASCLSRKEGACP